MKHSKLEVEDNNPLPGLSQDVIHEILLRLPLKPLLRCKVVSKSWNSIMSSPEFGKAHLRYSRLKGNNNSSSSSLLALQRYNTMSLAKFDSSENMIPNAMIDLIPSYHQFNPRLSGYYHQFLIGSSDGLVCVYLKKSGRPEDMMCIWNPTINKHKQISLPAEQGLTYLHVESSWFGFVPSLNTYKIFLVYNVYRPTFVERMRVCLLRDCEWREMRETNGLDHEESVNHPLFASESKAVVVNEAVHYLVDKKCIHKFDLVAETFERIPFGINPDSLPESCHVLLGGIRNNKCKCAMVWDYSLDWLSTFGFGKSITNGILGVNCVE